MWDRVLHRLRTGYEPGALSDPDAGKPAAPATRLDFPRPASGDIPDPHRGAVPMEALARTFDLMCVTFDTTGRILDLSPVARDSLELGVGDTVPGHLPDYLGSATHETLDWLFGPPAGEPLELALVSRQGRPRWWQAMLLSVDRDGEDGARRMLVARDLTGEIAAKQADKSRRRWQRIIVDVSRALSGTPAECYREALDRVLGLVGQGLRADRLFLMQKEQDAAAPEKSLSWSVQDADPMTATLDTTAFAGCDRLQAALVSGSPFIIPDADALSRDADRIAEITCMGRRGCRAILFAPLLSRGYVTGCIVAESVAARPEWDDLPESEWRTVVEILSESLIRERKGQELQLERERLREAQALARLGYWDWDPEIGLATWSEGTEDLLGLDPARCGSLSDLLSVFEGSDSTALELACVQALANDAQVDMELRWARRGPGDVVGRASGWAHVQARVVHRPHGEGRVLRGNILDISGLKENETRAQAAHARLRHLIASAPIVVYVQQVDGDRLVPEYASDNLRTVFGHETDDLGDSAWWQRNVHPSDFDRVARRTREILQEGHFVGEYRILDSQGSYHWVYEEGNLLRDPDGRPSEVVGIWLDVTGRKEAEAATEASERRYRDLVENAPALICRFGPDLRFRFVNRTLAEYLSRDPADLIGACWLDYLLEDQRAAYQRDIASLSPDQPFGTHELRILRADRRVRWQVWSERAFFDEHGNLVEIQAVGRDNTDLREAQSQLVQAAKLATLGEMTTSVAHEMNQPLNVIRMAVYNARRSVLANRVDPGALLGKLERVEHQVARAAQIVDHMRVFGRKSHVQRQPFDPVEPLQDAVALLGEQLRIHGIRLDWTPPGTSRKVLGHPDQLEQILMNLVINARDAILGKGARGRQGREAQPWVRVEMEDDPQHRSVVIRVRDGGGGVPESLLDRVFEPFFTTKEVGQGTGLGLSIGFGIIKDMGGSIRVENEEHGACFTIQLPGCEDPATTSPEGRVAES
ncbi:PAS domain-containing sensor histidine kinase [Thioalkalivibrio nitratireducens]|nr:PAS domain-containing protein [Thioalkalivibrio nitratireducens]